MNISSCKFDKNIAFCLELTDEKSPKIFNTEFVTLTLRCVHELASVILLGCLFSCVCN